MLIRREDKTIIYYIALLGAVLSVFIASTLPGKLREKADSGNSQHNESVLQVGAMDKLKQASELTIQMDLIENVTKQLAAVEIPKETPTAGLSFWSSLHGWQVVVLSIGAGSLGYGVFWITMWSGVVSLYTFIRAVYYLIGRISPNCPAVQKPTKILDGRVVFERNPDRIIPLIIKLVILLTLTLSLLGIIVWQMTSFNL
jgi:hypothetical protein